jgi:hypothetical protein
MIEAILIGIVGYVFTEILMSQGMLMEWYCEWLGKQHYGGWMPEWVFKIMGGCGHCFTGQLAFWYYIFANEYSLPEHIAYVSVAIFTIEIIRTWLEKLKG